MSCFSIKIIVALCIEFRYSFDQYLVTTIDRSHSSAFHWTITQIINVTTNSRTLSAIYLEKREISLSIPVGVSYSHEPRVILSFSCTTCDDLCNTDQTYFGWLCPIFFHHRGLLVVQRITKYTDASGRHMSAKDYVSHILSKNQF